MALDVLPLVERKERAAVDDNPLFSFPTLTRKGCVRATRDSGERSNACRAKATRTINLAE